MDFENNVKTGYVVSKNDQINEMEASICSATDRHVVKRAIAIRQLHNGNSINEVSEMLMDLLTSFMSSTNAARQKR